MQTENGKNILPALYETPSTQMSSKEFQRMLYTWFEEKGLVSDLRSYLRVLMINELRNTTVGHMDHKGNFSLVKQAFNLIIAEHLLREGCHYTLSIFSTEVPGVANQLPFSLFEAHCRTGTFRFDHESLVSVLELIGISKGSNESLRITALYFKNDDSLLTCMISSKRMDALPDIENEGDYLHNVLTVLGVPSKMVPTIRQKIEDVIAREVPIERKQVEEMQALLCERNDQIKLLLDEQAASKKKNKRLKNELKEAQKCLKQAAENEHNLNLKEAKIREKLDEVTRLQRSLEKTLNKDEVCHLKHCTESCQSIARVNEELRAESFQLTQINKEKTVEIERLVLKVAAVTKDLQNSKLNIDFLNSCLVRSSQINFQQGGDPVSSSDEPSENLTGEVLKQVRSKLHDLERESDALDVKFKKLKLNDFVTK